MSRALGELSSTPQISDRISGTVTAKAHDATEVMARLAEYSAATKSARAGEAGRGFAVVASEVKDLARQSGENADTITRTLAEVRAQVDAAVARVAEISSSMQELNQQNGTLATAIEEQSSVVRQIVESIGTTAAEADRMADGVR